MNIGPHHKGRNGVLYDTVGPQTYMYVGVPPVHTGLALRVMRPDISVNIVQSYPTLTRNLFLLFLSRSLRCLYLAINAIKTDGFQPLQSTFYTILRKNRALRQHPNHARRSLSTVGGTHSGQSTPPLLSSSHSPSLSPLPRGTV